MAPTAETSDRPVRGVRQVEAQRPRAAGLADVTAGGFPTGVSKPPRPYPTVSWIVTGAAAFPATSVAPEQVTANVPAPPAALETPTVAWCSTPEVASVVAQPGVGTVA